MSGENNFSSQIIINWKELRIKQNQFLLVREKYLFNKNKIEKWMYHFFYPNFFLHLNLTFFIFYFYICVFDYFCFLLLFCICKKFKNAIIIHTTKLRSFFFTYLFYFIFLLYFIYYIIFYFIYDISFIIFYFILLYFILFYLF